MIDEWADFADQAATRWIELGAAIDPVSFRIGVRIERIARRHEAMIAGALAPFRRSGIRNTEDFRLLGLLARHYPEATTATTASRLLGISKAATSIRIDRFVTDGLVDRITSDNDKRFVEVRSSEQGLAVALDCVNAVAQVHHRLIDGLSESELTACDTALGAIMSRFI